MSPIRPQIYRTNSDYYRGKVKSVYEKDPLFKDFMRNLPLTESNLTEDVNLSALKKRFHNLVQSRRGAENHPDPIFAAGVRQVLVYIDHEYNISREYQVCTSREARS